MEEPTLSYIDKKKIALQQATNCYGEPLVNIRLIPFHQNRSSGFTPSLPRAKIVAFPVHETPIYIPFYRGKFVYNTTHTNQRTLLWYTCVIPQSGENRCLFYLPGFPLYPQSFNCMEQELVVCLCDFMFQLLSIIKVLQ